MDLTNQRIGKLVVLYKVNKKSKYGKQYWHCRCDCGNEKDICESNLTAKKNPTQSCGCLRLGKNFKDLTGKKFNAWTILRHIQGGVWECECECGKKKNITVSNVVSGKSKSCGCKRTPKRGMRDRTIQVASELVGTRKGHFTILGFDSKEARWKCRCDCGNIVYKSLTNISDTSMCRSCRDSLKVGKVFGDFIVLDEKIVKNRKTYWKVKCQYCGQEAYKRIDGSSQLICECQKITPYPQWFIDELADDSYKSLARHGYLRTSERVKFICPIHGAYEQYVYAHIRIKTQEKLEGCPQCSISIAHSGSSVEQEIKKYVETITNKPFVKARVLDGKEIDLYNDELKLGVEYNGSAFHATEGGIYGNKPKYYHRDKFLLAKEKGIRLISIFDVDWKSKKNFFFTLLKSIIVGTELHKLPNSRVLYTDNDFDDGEWLRKYGYKEVCQEEPTYYKYKSYLVFRCGRTRWEK